MRARTGRRRQPDDGRRLTVDELARAGGTTVRNVRALQARGVLPPPDLAGRTGHYRDAHLARLRAVLRLQTKGYSLAAVADLLAAWDEGRTLDDVLGLPARRRRRPATGGELDWTATFDELTRRPARAPL